MLKTALDAFELSIRPVVVEDACASDGGEAFHEAGLMVLRRLVGEGRVVKVAEAESWMGRW